MGPEMAPLFEEKRMCMNTKILCAGTFLLMGGGFGMYLNGSVNSPVFFVGSIALGTIWLAVKFK